MGAPKIKERVFASCWKCRTANTIRRITEIRHRHNTGILILYLLNVHCTQRGILFLCCFRQLMGVFKVWQLFQSTPHVMFILYSLCSLHQSFYHEKAASARCSFCSCSRSVAADKKIECFTFKQFRGGCKLHGHFHYF